MVMAGYIPIASVEIMKEAIETYKYNFINNKNFEEIVKSRDIRENSEKNELYKYDKGKAIDVIVGGFPCQGFSMAGKRIVEDPRNSLYLDMLEIVKILKPKILIMENVEGILSMLEGKIVEKIISDYENIGYKITYKVLNAQIMEFHKLEKE